MKKTLYRLAIVSLIVISIVALTGCDESSGTVKPTDITALAGVGSGNVKISWTAPTADEYKTITKYTVYYSATQGVTVDNKEGHLPTSDGTTTELVVGSGLLTDDTNYYFIVTASTADKESDPSDEVMKAPSNIDNAAPTGTVTAVVVAGTDAKTTMSVTITKLTDGFGNYDGKALIAADLTYNIYVVTNDTAVTDLASLQALVDPALIKKVADIAPGTDTAIVTTVDGLTANTAYDIYVTAANGNGEGSMTAKVEHTTGA